MHIIEITIQRQTENRWPVVIEHNTLNNLPVRRHEDLQLSENKLLTQVTPHGYGRVLGEAIFHGAIRDTFISALHAAGDDYLRVLLHIEAESLKSLRWERLCAPFAGGWDMLLLNQHTVFAHYLPSLTDLRFRPFGRQDLRALVLVASPNGLDEYRMHQFDAMETARQVRKALGSIPNDLLVNDMPEAVGPATLKALARQLTVKRYTLVHFVAHGQFSRINGETALFLADEQNQVDRVNSDKMLAQLRSLQPAHGFPHFTFLGTCDSAAPEAENVMGGLAQRLVRDLGMPAVLAMTEQVSIHTLQVLTKAFYERLREHGEADRALVEATTTIDTPHHDIIVPAIYTRLEGRPLFSDNLERTLTKSEIFNGLARMETLINERAPILQDEFKQKAAELRLAPTESQQLYPISQLCQDTLEVSFPALALGLDEPTYDGRCPFQGLAAFGTDDQNFFFGREELVIALVGRLQTHPFLAVRGPSGGGKSSLILAGVIPTLQITQPELIHFSMTPGTAPLQGLENLLAANPKPGLLFVDQFEELFTLCTDVEQRTAFVERLLSLSALDDPPMIVLALRDDFWDDCREYGNLYAKMEGCYQQIAPLAANVLRSAVEQQASAVGLRFEADLSNTILDDVADEPGAMPLLQHGLKELWEHRHGRWLRASEYRKIGGIRQAIARTAERIYNSCTQSERALMENVMLRLIRLDGDVATDTQPRDTRRRALRSELTPLGQGESATRSLVARLANESLVITKQDPATSRNTVEIAHEALIGYWDRLQKWLRTDREMLLLRQDINNATRHWLEKNRGRSLLYQGQVLKEARALASKKPALLNEDEHEFLQAGQRHERQRLLSGILLPALAMAVAALVISWTFNLWLFELPTIELGKAGLEKVTTSFVWGDDEEETLYVGLSEPGQIKYRGKNDKQWDNRQNVSDRRVRKLIRDSDQPSAFYALLDRADLVYITPDPEAWDQKSLGLPTAVESIRDFAISPDRSLYIGDGDKPGIYTCPSDTCTSDTWRRIDTGAEMYSGVRFMGWVSQHLLVSTQDSFWQWEAGTQGTDEWTLLHDLEKPIYTAVEHDTMLFAGGAGIFVFKQQKFQCVLKKEKTFTAMTLFDKTEKPIVIAGTSKGLLYWWYASDPLCSPGGDTVTREIPFENGSHITMIAFEPKPPHKLWVSAATGLYSGNTEDWRKEYAK